MTEIHSEFNPCCCISVRAGATLISVYDVIYGSVYLLRQRYVESLHEDYPSYFPEDIPNPTGYGFMRFMFRLGNYVLMDISGVMLLISTQVLIELSFLIYLNALIGSGVPHFVRYGQELFANFALQIYFIVVVSMFIRESRMEFNNMRAIKPINIVQGEHEEYLSTDRKNKFFNTATSFQFLTPQFYVHAKTISGERLLADPSVLQYTVTKSIVTVRKSDSDDESESESIREVNQECATPKFTLTHPTSSISLKESNVTNEDSNTSITVIVTPDRSEEHIIHTMYNSDMITDTVDASNITLNASKKELGKLQEQSSVSLEEMPSSVRVLDANHE
ncbi:unnamed protein product [Orchesella dallaii]|uniref:Transmembrane protein n=1 Tax=Orchesella dallaii TaxID=48710 RepID=A0ABP1S298_9HEXA